MSNITNNYNGIGLPVILSIIFIILKLTHTIDWSWYWVLAPIWIGFAIGILIFIGYAIVLFVGLLILHLKRKK